MTLSSAEVTHRFKGVLSGGEDPPGDVSAGAALRDTTLRLHSPRTVDFYDEHSSLRRTEILLHVFNKIKGSTLRMIISKTCFSHPSCCSLLRVTL